MANTQERIPLVPKNTLPHQKKLTLDAEKPAASLDLTRAFDGEIVCTIYCEGGNKFEILATTAGNLLVANAQKQLGDHNALYILREGKKVFITPGGEFVSAEENVEDEGYLVSLANTAIRLADGQRRITKVETSDTRKNVLVSEHIIET